MPTIWGVGIAMLCIGQAGCDRLFGLDHVDHASGGFDAGDVIAADARQCAPATGAPMTKLFGRRTNGLSPTGAADTFVVSDAAHLTSNFGGLDTIFVCQQCVCDSDCYGIAGNDDDVVGLLRFDLAAEIPACSEVISATLLVTTTTDAIGSGSDLAVYGILEPWEEGNGAIADGIVGVASWNERTPDKSWTEPGVGAPNSRAVTQIAAFDPESEETTYVPPVDVTVVQRWVDDPASNHGMALLVTGESSDVHFYSREAADPAKRPGFEVVYAPP